MIDWSHHYWRFAERWNGRLAMVGVLGGIIFLTVREKSLYNTVRVFLPSQMQQLLFVGVLALVAYTNVGSLVLQ